MESVVVQKGTSFSGLVETSGRVSPYTKQGHGRKSEIRVEAANLQQASKLGQTLPDDNRIGASPALCVRELQDFVLPDMDMGKYKLGKYRIKKGDTLSTLSRRCGLPVEQLAELNDIEDPDLIEAGAKILVAFPKQFIEELAEHIPPRQGGGEVKATPGPRLKVYVRERKVGVRKVHKTPAPEVLERDSVPAATPSQPVRSGVESSLGAPHLRGEASWPDAALRGWGGLRTPAFTASISSVEVPRMPHRPSPQWASLGALLLLVAASSVAVRVGANQLWGAYVSVWSHLAERRAADKRRRAAKRAEAQRMKNWWRAVVDDDRKAAQLAPDAVNGSVTSRLPSEPSIGKQAREIEQKRLEEEYNTFIRKIKVKDKDDGLIG